MIKKTLIFSIIFLFQQTATSASCPTCPKGYAASSLEGLMISKQKAKTIGLKKIPQDLFKSQQKAGDHNHKMSAVQIVANPKQLTQNSASKSTPNLSRSYAPKRDRVSSNVDVTSLFQTSRKSDFSTFPDNQNLRGTHDKNVAIATQQQFRQQMRNLKR